MTLAIIIFLLAAAVLMLITIPFVMLISEVKNLWVHVRLWAIVLASWLAVWLAVSYGA